MTVHSPIVATDGPLWITCAGHDCDWQTQLTDYGGEVTEPMVHEEFNRHLVERFHRR